MTSKRVSAPADLMSEFDDDDAAAQIYRTTATDHCKMLISQAWPTTMRAEPTYIVFIYNT